ncbi:plant cysteine oxidase 2 [Dendrobium catenatum]|uniref:cysteine dioxygenase n=1 Tax=Dendrobium catenatum TaxID=906689 RepID=A0A2I0VT47_9ASPA|nr:plant cysteine oxidase 2 [Dendrobium catenatum]PKU66587.1 cysteamine dioxygenase [Dendrobium catenatum]
MKVEGSAMGEKRKAVEGRKKYEQERIARRRGGGGGFGRPPRVRRVLAGSSSAAIQRLFEVCMAVFKGPRTVPSPKDVQMLQLVLDKLKPEDVGLSTDLPFFKDRSTAKETPAITYTHIYNCDKFSMCIFFLPPTAVIPLHNHPGMTVFSKLLLGTMHIKSYDWVDNYKTDKDPPSAQSRLAKIVENSDFTAPCETSILYPTTGGNIHTFRAITPCAVLDILGPPYSKEDDRDCTYYKDHLYADVAEGDSTANGRCDNSFRWLEEIEIPKDLKMTGIEYRGPQILDG